MYANLINNLLFYIYKNIFLIYCPLVHLLRRLSIMNGHRHCSKMPNWAWMEMNIF